MFLVDGLVVDYVDDVFVDFIVAVSFFSIVFDIVGVVVFIIVIYFILIGTV